MARANTATTVFTYKGTDRKGKKVEGELSGTSQAIVKAQLVKQGIRPKLVKRKPKPLLGGSKKIKPMDIAVFSRQMATMMKAGVPLVQSFDIVSEGTNNDSMKDLINQIRTDVAAGSGFANALKKHRKYFDELYCNLVESGEQSGALETLLDRIATYKEKTESLKAKIKKAMTYPIAVVVVAILVTVGLLVWVVPQFASTFASFGAELPAITQMVLNMSEAVQAYWLILLVCLVAIAFLFNQAKQRSAAFRRQLDVISLKLPVVGAIVYNSILARYARTLSTTFAAGVPLIDSLESVAGAAGNVIYKEKIVTIRDQVSTGVQLNQAMKTSKVFPSMMIQMASIGEESGSLDEMLAKTADYHEEVVDNMVDNLTALMEPFIMVVLGTLVGGLLVAMYMPIFQLGSVI